jgi:hypothetical protein
MDMPSMRELIDIMEARGAAHEVVRYDAPNSGRVVDRTVIRATNSAELRAGVRAWMDSIGLDPDDEDDQAHVEVLAR